MKRESRVLTHQEIIKTLRENIESLKKFKVKKIGIFGSYTRDEQRKKSDIDLLVEFDKSAFDKNLTGYSDNYNGLLHELKKSLGRKIDLVTQDTVSPFIRPYIEKEIEYLETT